MTVKGMINEMKGRQALWTVLPRSEAALEAMAKDQDVSGIIRICPKCKSPYWQRPVRKMREAVKRSV